jgi:hypothetical protein
VVDVQDARQQGREKQRAQDPARARQLRHRRPTMA